MNGVCLVTPKLVLKLLLIKSVQISVRHHTEASRNEMTLRGAQNFATLEVQMKLMTFGFFFICPL